MLDLRAALAQCPIAAILRGVKPDEIDAIGDALVEAGVTVIEVPLNSPQPFESIKRLAARHGTTRSSAPARCSTAADVARVKDAGGKLIVAPNFDADVVRAAKAAGLAALPGVMTPSEGFAALKAGADGLKLFPGRDHPARGVQGVARGVSGRHAAARGRRRRRRQHLQTYAEAGASGYGIGSALYKPGRPAAEIGKLARALVAAAKA